MRASLDFSREHVAQQILKAPPPFATASSDRIPALVSWVCVEHDKTSLTTSRSGRYRTVRPCRVRTATPTQRSSLSVLIRRRAEWSTQRAYRGANETARRTRLVGFIPREFSRLDPDQAPASPHWHGQASAHVLAPGCHDRPLKR